MIIIGVDYHPSDQYIKDCRYRDGECGERRLNHGDGEAGEVLSRFAAESSQCVRGDGGHRIFALVRAMLAEPVSKCGSAMRRRSKPKSPQADLTATMRNCCFGATHRNNFPGCVASPENVICDSCFGIAHRLVQMRTRIRNPVRRPRR